MNAREVAGIVGVHERTVRRAIADGRLNATRAGRGFDVNLEDARALFGSRAPGDAELDALRAVNEALAPLDEQTRDRIVRWAIDRFDVATT